MNQLAKKNFLKPSNFLKCFKKLLGLRKFFSWPWYACFSSQQPGPVFVGGCHDPGGLNHALVETAKQEQAQQTDCKSKLVLPPFF
jgi:hypothetical protein